MGIRDFGERWEDMVERRGQHLEVGTQTDSKLWVGMTRPFSNSARMMGARTWGGRRGDRAWLKVEKIVN